MANYYPQQERAKFTAFIFLGWLKWFCIIIYQRMKVFSLKILLTQKFVHKSCQLINKSICFEKF